MIIKFTSTKTNIYEKIDPKHEPQKEYKPCPENY